MTTKPTPQQSERLPNDTAPEPINHQPDQELPTYDRDDAPGYTHDHGKKFPGGNGNRGQHSGKLPPFLAEQFAEVYDPTTKIPQFAVRKQKIVTLSEDQYKRLALKELTVVALSGKEKEPLEKILVSLNEQFESRVSKLDCPERDENNNPVHTVLLDWVEDTSNVFPELRLVDSAGRSLPISQTNNYLVVSFGDRDTTNNPPARPPITGADPLNTQPSDFRPMAPVDEPFYRKYQGHDKGPAVAVVDTGLKFNLHNQSQEAMWADPHVYRDADGQERRFSLAYQDESSNDCGGNMSGSSLGYCALQAYRQTAFIQQMKLLSTMTGPYTANDVMNSPFDDCVILDDPSRGLGMNNIKDARHGTSITAIIQQHGDDAPVLPVKAFDNFGYATLFDVLNAFNYVLHRCEKSAIRVVNTSWIFGRDEPLLKKKIEQLLKAGVFVVAAAGNEGQTLDRNLDNVNVFPACYSAELPNVITVTSVRKTYIKPNALSPKGDTIIGNLLTHLDDAGLSTLVDIADDVVGAIAPIQGYVAVENYSTRFVNVGVVSSRGLFRSPFQHSPAIKGSSYACAYVSGFVIRQLRTDADLLRLVKSGAAVDMNKARHELLTAMSGADPNLAQEYVAGGYFLDGYAMD